MTQAKDRYAVIIGLDGVPLGLLKKLAEEGVMPWLHGRLGHAVSSELEVLVPYTAPSWPTISTGVNPGKHGIYDFLVPRPNAEPRPATRMDLEWPYVTEMASANGLPSVSISVPFNYPPFVRSGVRVVSGWTSARLETWPPGDRDEALRLLGGEHGPPKPSSLEEYVDTVIENTERQAELIKAYYTGKPWRVFYFVLPGPDWVFHYTYGDVVQGTRLGKRVHRLFRVIDGLIRFLYENAPGETLFIHVSDHGFMEAREALNGNVLLEREGLLRRSEERVNLRSRLVLRLAAMLPPWLKHRLKYSSLAVLARRLGAAAAFEYSRLPIDYAASKAYFTSAYSVYTNPGLPREERERVASRVLELLQRYRGMLRVAARGREFFWGPHVDRAPDVVVIPREGYNVTTRLAYRSVVEKGRWYVHGPRGMLILDAVGAGDASPRLPEERPPFSMDVAPTVLAWLGLPLDPGFDGEPLLEGVKPGELGRRSYRVLARLGKRVSALKRSPGG